LLLSLGLAIQSLPTLACSFSTDTIFTYNYHPDFPLAKYSAGKLGILDSAFARSYLLIAYRYLSGAPLSAKEQQAMQSLWTDRLTSSDYGCTAQTSTWLAARKQVPGASAIDSITTERSISADESWQTYCNCQTPAFETAAATLKERIAKFGADSAAVKNWLAAQDQVFSNCGHSWSEKQKPAVIPAVSTDVSDPLSKQDRAYQIAAAHFYCQQLDTAQQEFEAIAADTNSPWRQIAGYLAVRSMIRRAMLAKEMDKALLTSAHEKLKQMMSDPLYANMTGDLRELSDFISARIAPEQHLKALSGEVTKEITPENACEFTKTLDLILEDDGSTKLCSKYSDVPAAAKHIDLTDWIVTFQATDPTADQHSFQKWKQTHSLPWLVAALASASAGDPITPALLTAARAVPRSSPAYWTAFYHTNRLDIDRGKTAQARKALDAVLATTQPDLPPGCLNQIRTLRLTVATSLSDFVHLGIQTPVCLTYTTDQVPDDVKDMEAGKAAKNAPLFTQEAGYVMDKLMPLSVLTQLAKDPKIPHDLRNHLAWSAWVRAILVGDDAAARNLAVIAKPLNKARTALFDTYLAAQTPEARKLAAVILMLKYSSAQPNPGWGPLLEDSYGDASGWWWGAPPVANYNSDSESGSSMLEFDPLFLTPAQSNQAKVEIKKLAGAPTAPDFFARTVLAWAEKHPTDPMVPQALHLVVRSTRYGATSNATGGLSKAAFRLLHSKYKTSPWTKQTPYYY